MRGIDAVRLGAFRHRSPCSLAGPVEMMVPAQTIRTEERVVSMCTWTHWESGRSTLMQCHAALRGRRGYSSCCYW